MKNKLIILGLIIALIIAFSVIVGLSYCNEGEVFTNSLPKSRVITKCQDQEEEKEAYVYITKTGKKYHKESCRYLKKSKIKITLKDACKRGYAPCKVCKPPKCPN